MPKTFRFYIKFSFVALLFLFFFCFLHSTSSQAQVDPNIEWKKITLPHFDLVFDARHQDLANIYAPRLETAYQNLSRYFQIMPKKTTVVLDYRTDLTNGAATAFPYPLIYSYPALPSPQESIGEFGDWASELATHEFTHVLAMSQRRDVVDTLSSMFGSIMTPNLLLPRWWHEGVAVEMETRFSAKGRLRSATQDAWIRSYILSDSWKNLTMSEANEVSMPSWPYGARPYFLGSLIWSELLTEKPSAIKDLSWAHGGRLPYLINAPAENLLGMEYADYYKKVHMLVEQRAKKQIEILEKVKPTNFQPLELDSIESLSPAISPDGLRIAFIGKEETLRRSIQVLERPNTQVPFDATHLKKSADSKMTESSEEMKAPIPRMHDEDGPPGGVMGRLEWFPNSKKILFDRIDKVNWYSDVSDLYSYDIISQKSERITVGLHAREAAISPDGKFIAFIKVLPGRTNLELYNMQTKSVSTLYEAPLQIRCSHPSFLNNTEIIFSKRERGHESLLLASIKNSTSSKEVLKDFVPAYFPEVIRGKLIFISVKNGVPNLFVANQNMQSAQPLTHTLTAISQSTWDADQDDYYVSQQTSRGIKLARIEKNKFDQTLPTVTPLFNDRYPTQGMVSNEAQNSLPQNQSVEDYSSLPYLIPKYWLPFFGGDSNTTYMTITTSAADPLGKHAWSFLGLYDLTNQKPGGVLTYNNFTTSANILTLLSDTNITLPSGNQHNQLAHIEADWQLLFLSPDWELALGWNWTKRELNIISTQAGPMMGLKYSNYTKSGIQISPETGLGGSFNISNFVPEGQLPSFNQYEASFVKYWSKWLPKRHAIMTKLQSFYIDQPTATTSYAITSSQLFSPDSPMPTYLMRGYPSGNFIGKTLNQANLEYRFPVKNLFTGWGTSPIYLRQIFISVVADGVSVEGFGYNQNRKLYQTLDTSKNFWSFGAEAHLSTTIGYHFPMEFYLGYYVPAESTLGASPNISFGLFL